MWPLALVRDLELWVRGGTTHRGRDLARAVAVQPDHVEIELVGPGFRILERVYVARERRAAWVLLHVECERDLELQVRFTPRIEPMWPAGLGGRIALRDDDTGAVALGEELGRFAALLGSPEAEPPHVDADHRAPHEPIVVRIPCSVARAQNGPLTFFIAGAERIPERLSEAARVGEAGAATGRSRLDATLDAAREEYRWIVREWPFELRRLEERWREFLDRTTHFESDDARHAEAFLWAKVAIEKAWVEVDGVGRSLVAGLAKSGDSERPGFGWFFGGDALTATRAMCAYGDFHGARRALEFVASQQRADGKMQHELTLSARLCNWTEDYPYAYYKAQITPGFIACLQHYVEWSGDYELVTQLWPNVLAAYRCCVESLEDDGLLSNHKLGIAAVEAGSLVGTIRADVYLQGIWLSALDALKQLASLRGDEQLKKEAEERHELADRALSRFWSDTQRRYAFASLADGSFNFDSTSYQALALSRRRAIPLECRADRTHAHAAALNRPNLASDWGVRLFADDASVYDATSYNTGSVFPYTNNFAILALFEHGLTTAGHQLLASQVALHSFSGLGFLPEHLRADRCETPERGVPHQVFSSSCIPQSTVFGEFGMFAHAIGWIMLRPQLPTGSRRAALRGVRVGVRRFDVEITREFDAYQDARTALNVRVAGLDGHELKVHLRPLVPPLSRAARERGRDAPHSAFGSAQTLERPALQVASDAEWRVDYESGPELLLPDEPLVEGATSSRVRVCEVESDESSVTWTLWGLAGRTYRVGVRSDRRVRFEGARQTSEHELEISFPSAEATKFVSLQLRAIALD